MNINMYKLSTYGRFISALPCFVPTFRTSASYHRPLSILRGDSRLAECDASWDSCVMVLAAQSQEFPVSLCVQTMPHENERIPKWFWNEFGIDCFFPCRTAIEDFGCTRCTKISRSSCRSSQSLKRRCSAVFLLWLAFWLVVWNIMNSIFLFIGNFIIPTDELIFLRGVGWNHQPALVCIGPQSMGIASSQRWFNRTWCFFSLFTGKTRPLGLGRMFQIAGIFGAWT